MKWCAAASLSSTSGPDSAAKNQQELVDARAIFFGVGRMREKSGIEFLGEQRVLETLHGPIENRNDESGVDVGADFATGDSEADKGGAAVRIFLEQKAIDFALEGEIHAVISEQGDAIGNPIFADEALGAGEPVFQGGEKTFFLNLRRAL